MITISSPDSVIVIPDEDTHTRTKTYDEQKCLDDALACLGITAKMDTIDLGSVFSIYFPHLSSEDICLAQAILEVGKEIQEGREMAIILVGKVPFLLQNKGLIPVQIHGEPTLHVKSDEALCSVNAKGFAKYSENKRFTGMILQWRGIRVPREMVLRDSRFMRCEYEEWALNDILKGIYRRTHERVIKFINAESDIKKFVAKPYDGKQGDGVRIFSREEFLSKDPDTQTFPEKTESKMTLVQEKIESYPLTIDGIVKDWNMRVLVTYDFKAKKYIVAGIVCRIDQEDMPVNISISAWYDSLFSVLGQTKIPKREWKKIKTSIEDTAIRSVEAITDYCDRKFRKPPRKDFQALAGIDIILDREKNPVVIEVNDMLSWCNYELMKLEGIESLYPIARAILAKAIMSAHTHEFIKAFRTWNWEQVMNLIRNKL